MSPAFRRQCRPALGTYVEVALHEDELPPSPRDQQAIFDAAFAVIAEVQRQMSFHDASSSLSRINQAVPGSTLEVPEWTYELLRIAMRIFDATEGRFDCGVGGHLVRAGLLPSQHADDAVIPAPSSIANLQLHGANYITVMHRVCLDFGGIAKGYAVDKAIEAVTSRGVSRCLINAGGDLRVTGDLAEKIFVRLPASPGTLVCLGCLSDGALATSAPYYSLQGEGAAARCALYAPSGKSLTQSLSYTVLAPECVIADALTKAVAVAFNQNTQARDAIAGRASVFLPYDPGFLIPFDAQAFIL